MRGRHRRRHERAARGTSALDPDPKACKGTRSSAWAKRRANKGVRRLGRYDVGVELGDHELGANKDESGYNRIMTREDVTFKQIHVKLTAIADADGGQWIGNFSDAMLSTLGRMGLVYYDADNSEYLRLTDRGEELLELLDRAG